MVKLPLNAHPCECRHLDAMLRKARAHPQTRARRNGLSCTMLIHSIRSQIRRLPEHRMVPADVCDGQEQGRSTLDGREVDLTGLVDARARDACVTV